MNSLTHAACSSVSGTATPRARLSMANPGSGATPNTPRTPAPPSPGHQGESRLWDFTHPIDRRSRQFNRPSAAKSKQSLRKVDCHRIASHGRSARRSSSHFPNFPYVLYGGRASERRFLALLDEVMPEELQMILVLVKPLRCQYGRNDRYL